MTWRWKIRKTMSEGRSVVVTGAAGGIGRATCERLAKDGFTVVAGCGPNSPRKDKWLAEQKALGYTFHASVGNVADWDSTVAAFAKAIADDLNAKGGLLGRPVKLVYYDDQTNPATVPGLYTKLLDVDKVDLLIAPYGTVPTGGYTLVNHVDPDGLLEYSVVYTDRALNHMSRKFQGVMRDISSVLTSAEMKLLPHQGTQLERAAMAFHAKPEGHSTVKPDGSAAVFKVNGKPAAPGAPFADPCPTTAPELLPVQPPRPCFVHWPAAPAPPPPSSRPE